MIVGIDPGPERSAWATYPEAPRDRPMAPPRAQGGTVPTCDLIYHLPGLGTADVAIEMVASYGMPVGREVFETCVWIGRLTELCAARNLGGSYPALIYRRDIKLYLCGSARAKDGNIRQALIDRLGAPGTKKAPGPTYGISGDAWQALAIAVYHHDVNLKGTA